MPRMEIDEIRGEMTRALCHKKTWIYIASDISWISYPLERQVKSHIDLSNSLSLHHPIVL